jgi:type II secretory pathway pseudopilin PulG
VIDSGNTALISRAGALLVLLLLCGLISPVITAPYFDYVDKQAMIEREQRLIEQAQQRLSMLETMGERAPFIRASTREEAVMRASYAIAAAAPAAALRLISVETSSSASPQSDRIDVTVSAEAIPIGLSDFAAALANGEPKLAVTRFQISRHPTTDAGSAPATTKLLVQITVTGLFVKGDPT